MALDVTPDSLVLLDEIGSSTDPEEGGALGVALVDHFRAAGAFTLASTHLTALKIYGARTKTVLNASMGFDEETLEPTYQLRTGLPGKSAGLEIAARLGMPEDILKRARASLSRHEIELAELVADLHRRTEATSRIATSLEKERAELVEKEKRIAADAERKEAAKIRELETRFEEMQRSWQTRADETVARIAETSDKRKAADQAQRQAARLTREMREEWTSVTQGAQTFAPARPEQKIEEGTRLRLKGIREPARVRRLLGQGRFEVEAGFMKMQVGAEDIEEVLPAQAAGAVVNQANAKLPKNVRFQPGPELSPSVREINVIGERAEDAVEKVERFLDAAVMATAARVRIVHGHGMGILRRAIQDLLKQSPHVEKYYPASQYEGGTGATIVELKD
jgi:DNA mismatch repair protein MutS2